MRSLGPLIQYDWCSYKKRRLEHRHTQRRSHVKMEKMAVCKPRREASEETNLLTPKS